MKRTIISTLLLLFAATQLSLAQAPQPAPQPGKNKGAEKKELMDAKLQIIKAELALTDEQFNKFAPIYRQYSRNIDFNRRRAGRINLETASKQEINEYLKNRIDNSINVGMVRKVYIQIFERVLTPQQVVKLYSMDNRLSRQAREELAKRRNPEAQAQAPAEKAPAKPAGRK
ncbi:MAG TPA: hypothetical protein H9919_06320 [Candidatus Alistipes excrementipullorum]|nr:hypothetical protein [Candidatus Alistipes excrementipullorum]